MSHEQSLLNCEKFFKMFEILYFTQFTPLLGAARTYKYDYKEETKRSVFKKITNVVSCDQSPFQAYKSDGMRLLPLYNNSA